MQKSVITVVSNVNFMYVNYKFFISYVYLLLIINRWYIYIYLFHYNYRVNVRFLSDKKHIIEGGPET